MNFVCEIPKYSRKKYEIATKEDGNPIKQDEKKGVRIFSVFVCVPVTIVVPINPPLAHSPNHTSQILPQLLREFKRGDLQFNYGCLPRTWEDPNQKHPDTGFNGGPFPTPPKFTIPTSWRAYTHLSPLVRAHTQAMMIPLMCAR